MIQGTMSNAGKSLLAAGLCRIFRQDGYRVAPFKSQNMALNSYVTSEGLEMGRAQVMQAEAAGILPAVDMNPILLKPTSDTGSQVIVCGKPLADMDARTYFRYKKKLIPQILEAYRRLDEAYDIVVIEGAGSPAEINLKSDDIVNMGLARMLHAPVLLVGDIDRGGVFAQLAGTMLLLEEEEKALVRGLIINKFRGDVSLLMPGIELLKKYTDIPVIGTVPYMDIDLDDEDSLSERLHDKAGSCSGGKNEDPDRTAYRVCVIRFPHLSNFTDFNALQRIRGLSLSYVSPAQAPDLLHADMVILPGTKNTLGDLRWLKDTGIAEYIIQTARKGIPVMGICGGYQMLGRHIRDPHNAEGGGSEEGLGLLPLQTVFSGRKNTRQTRGSLPSFDDVWESFSGITYEAYEIHMGETRTEDGQEALCCQDKNVFGTYLHGIFDTAWVQEAFFEVLRRSSGRDLGGQTMFFTKSFVDNRTFKELQYDKLAQTLRASLDMKAVYEILEGSMRC